MNNKTQETVIEQQLEIWNETTMDLNPIICNKENSQNHKQLQIPPSIFKQSLFVPISKRKGRRAGLFEQKVGEQGSYAIYYTGHQLAQSDLDAFIVIIDTLKQLINCKNYDEIRNCNSNNLEYIQITLPLKPLTKRIKNTTATGTKKWLKASISRLQKGAITVTHNKESVYSASIISKYKIIEKIKFSTNKKDKTIKHIDEFIELQFNADLLPLLINEKLLNTSFPHRISMKKDTTKWLHQYISRTEYNYESIETLFKHSSSTHENIKNWIRQALKPSFKELLDKGILTSYTIPSNIERNIHWVIKKL